MKFIKTDKKEFTLALDEQFYQRGGSDVVLHADTSKNEVEIVLPSLRDEAKMRIWFKVFVFDVMRNSSVNTIIIKAKGEEWINGASEIRLNLNGIGVMIVPVGKTDWICFAPFMQESKKSDKSNKKEAAAA